MLQKSWFSNFLCKILSFWRLILLFVWNGRSIVLLKLGSKWDLWTKNNISRKPSAIPLHKRTSKKCLKRKNRKKISFFIVLERFIALTKLSSVHFGPLLIWVALPLRRLSGVLADWCSKPPKLHRVSQWYWPLGSGKSGSRESGALIWTARRQLVKYK